MQLKVTITIEGDHYDDWPPEARRSAETWVKNLVNKRLSGLGRAGHPVTRRGRTYKAIIGEIKVEADPAED